MIVGPEKTQESIFSSKINLESLKPQTASELMKSSYFKQKILRSGFSITKLHVSFLRLIILVK
jgi:hypothetical protein